MKRVMTQNVSFVIQFSGNSLAHCMNSVSSVESCLALCAARDILYLRGRGVLLGKHIHIGVNGMGAVYRLPVVFLATVALIGGAQAQQDTSGTAPSTQVKMTATLQALQTAVDNNSTAIFNLLNSVPRDQRGPLANLLLTAGQNVQDTDKSFSASAPSGPVIVNILLSSSVNGGFGFTTTGTSGFLIANLVVTENQNQTQARPN
jgi:hypothetical protein